MSSLIMEIQLAQNINIFQTRKHCLFKCKHGFCFFFNCFDNKFNHRRIHFQPKLRQKMFLLRINNYSKSFIKDIDTASYLVTPAS